MSRAAFYIDGFNFYHRLAEHAHATSTPSLKWMSYRQMAETILPRHESLEFVKVFTAMATHLPASMARHRQLIKAWKHEGCTCVLGEFKRKSTHCKKCSATFEKFEEKQSDINIAIHLFNDARLSKMDIAYVVSCDSDLAPVLHLCRKEFPKLKLITVAPPGLHISRANRNACHGQLSLTFDHVKKCVMPNEIYDGGKLICKSPYA